MTANLHHEKRSIETLLARIRGEKLKMDPRGSAPIYGEPVPEPNKTSLLNFYRFCVAEEISTGRTSVLLGNMYRVSCWLEHRPFGKLTKEDIIDLIDKIRNMKHKMLARRVSKEGYSEQTVESYKIGLRKFWRWLKNPGLAPEEVKDLPYPPEVAWIKRKKKKNGLLPEDIWSPEEIRKLAEVTNNLRDRAFVLGLFSSGCRIGEYMLLRRRDVIFDEYGCQLIIQNSKTGSRRVRVVVGSTDLAKWLDIHIDKDPEARIWISLIANKPVGYDWAARLLRELTKKAGINKKCNPHLYRHSAATHYAPKLTEQVMNAHFGWEQGGRTVATYTHLSGKQVDDQLLAFYGKKKIDNGHEVLESIHCSRCKTENSPASKFCSGCGFALTDEAAKEALMKRKKADRIMNVATKYPDFMEVLERIIKKEGLE